MRRNTPKKQNCVVYYCDPIELSLEQESPSYIDQMQLIVFPVTSKFLFKDSYAMSVEYRYVVEHNIAVLALMQEHGLESAFNQKCGEIQFLNKHDYDPTAISYDDKLTRFLNSVLISERLIEEIRSAFDAYIFLSYRKNQGFCSGILYGCRSNPKKTSGKRLFV